MAWQNPKTDWTGADGVRAADLNRIEGNILELSKINANETIGIYVSTQGNDDTGAGTFTSPFRTIGKALRSIPRTFISGHNVSINIDSGTYNETLIVSGFAGTLNLHSNGIVSIDFMRVEGCNVYHTGSQTNFKRGLVLDYGASYTSSSLMYVSEAGSNGIIVRNGSRFVLYNTATVSNTTSAAIEVSGGSMLYISIIAGTNNVIGLRTDTGSIACYGSMNMSATTLRISNTGGRIYTGSSLS